MITIEQILEILETEVVNLERSADSGNIHEANKARGMASQTLTEYREILGDDEYHHYTDIISNIEVEGGYNQND